MLGELYSSFACLVVLASPLCKTCHHWPLLHGCVLPADTELMSCEAMFQSRPFLEQVAHFQLKSKYNAKAFAKYCTEPLGPRVVKICVHV